MSTPEKYTESLPIRENEARFWESRFGELQEVWAAGNLAGLYDAAVGCEGRYYLERMRGGVRFYSSVPESEDSVAVPRWVLDGMLTWMKREMEEESCPTRKWLARYGRDLKHLERFESVQAARDQGAKWTEDPGVGVASVHKEASDSVNERRRLRLDADLSLRLDDRRVYIEPSPATPGGVQESYKKVKKEALERPNDFYASTYVKPGKKSR